MYYVISGGTQYGPYPLDKLRRLLAAGQLKPGDPAWAEGMTGKVPLQALLADPGKYAPSPPDDPPEEEEEDAPARSRPYLKSGLATVSLVLGIVAFVCASSIYTRLFPIPIAVYGGLGAGLLAVVLGHVARRGIKRSQGRRGGAGSALTGVICGYIAIVPSLLTVVAALGYRSIMNRGKTVKMEGNILTIVSYIDMYAVKNSRRPPSMAAGLQDLVAQGILRDETLLTDPWGEPIQYKVPAARSGAKFDVWSNGPDHLSGTEDDIGNWARE